MALARHAYEGSDPSAVEACVAPFGIHVAAKPLPGLRILSSKSAMARVPGVSLWDSEHEKGLMLTPERPPDAVLACESVQGEVALDIGGAEHVATPEGLLVADGADVDSMWFGIHTHTIGVAIDRAALQDRLGVLLDREPVGGLAFRPMTEASDGQGQAFTAVLSGMAQAVLRGALRLDSPAIATLARALPGLLLECVPNNYSEALQHKPPGLAPRQVKRAMAYMQENPRASLTIDELAAVSGVSVRSLQYAFRDFVGVSPAAYWRRQRLTHALAEIRKNDGRSISAIAAEWGFHNITRFRALCRTVEAADAL